MDPMGCGYQTSQTSHWDSPYRARKIPMIFPSNSNVFSHVFPVSTYMCHVSINCQLKQTPLRCFLSVNRSSSFFRSETFWCSFLISSFQVYAQQIKMCRDTARAMCYLHTFNPMIIHRDLKSLNMLLYKPVTGELKPRHSNGVVDF